MVKTLSVVPFYEIITILITQIYCQSNETICDCLVYGALDSDCVRRQEKYFSSTSASLPECYNYILRNISRNIWDTKMTKWLSFRESLSEMDCEYPRLKSLSVGGKRVSLRKLKIILGNSWRESSYFQLNPVNFKNTSCETIPVMYNMVDMFIDTTLFKHLSHFTNNSHFSFTLRIANFIPDDLFHSYAVSVPLRHRCNTTFFECNHLYMFVELNFATKALQVNFIHRSKFRDRYDQWSNTFPIFPPRYKLLVLDSDFQKFMSAGLICTLFFPRILFGDLFYTVKPINFSQQIMKLSGYFLLTAQACKYQPSFSNSLNLTLVSKRLFNNSKIKFTLKWKPYILPEEAQIYSVKCKLFNKNDEKYHSEACKLCYNNSTYCTNCIEEDYSPMEGHSYYANTNNGRVRLYQPFNMRSHLYLDTKHDRYRQGVHLGNKANDPLEDSESISITISIRNNLDAYIYRNRTLHWNPPPSISEKNQFNIMLFNWYRGNWRKYRKYNFNYNFQHAIVVPIRHGTNFKSIPNNELQNYFALCSVKRSDSRKAGTWSSTVKVELDASYIHQTELLIRRPAVGNTFSIQKIRKQPETKDSKKQRYIYNGIRIQYMDNSQNGVLLIQSGNSDTTNKEVSRLETTGCYHYIFGCWYILLKENQELNVAMHCSNASNLVYDQIPWKKVFTVIPDIVPRRMKCPELHAYLIWSATLNSEVKLYKLHLDPITAQPISPLIELNGKELCQCAKSKRRQLLPYIDILYDSLQNVDEPKLTVICGEIVCAYGPEGSRPLVRLQNFASCKNLRKLSQYFSTICDFRSLYFRDYEIYDISVDIRNVYTLWCDEVDPKKNRIYIIETGHQSLMQNSSIFLSKHGENNCKDSQMLVCKEDSSGLPVVPKHCMFPKLVEQTLKLSMKSEYTIRMEADLYLDSRECHRFAKPSFIFWIQYVLLKQNQTGINYTCFENHLGLCQQLKGQPTRSLKAEVEFSSLAPNRNYYFEISVVPEISSTLMNDWYSGARIKVIKRKFRTRYVPPASAKSMTKYFIGISIGAVVTPLLMLGFSIWIYRRKYYLYQALKRISIKEIHRQGKLGEGHYGEVWKSKLKGKKDIVVKILKQSATNLEEKQFREEALLLSKLQSNYIIRPVGICLQSRPIMLALEFINGGSVDQYLRREDVQNTLKQEDLFLIVEQAVTGCLYLENEGYIHRDLSTRNLLVQLPSSTNVKPRRVKLSDFGLAKDTGFGSYYNVSNADIVLPIAWSSPEAFQGHFSIKSDVWAFGVVIWEVFSWASTPYRSCSMRHQCPMTKMTHQAVKEWVCSEMKNLSHIQKPCNGSFSSSLRNIMEWCWAYDPDERPYFSQLQKFLVKSKQNICDSAFVSEPPVTSVNTTVLQSEREERIDSNDLTSTQLCPFYNSGNASLASTEGRIPFTRRMNLDRNNLACGSETGETEQETEVGSTVIVTKF